MEKRYTAVRGKDCFGSPGREVLEKALWDHTTIMIFEELPENKFHALLVTEGEIPLQVINRVCDQRLRLCSFGFGIEHVADPKV